jgi:hypothetical protein
MGFLRTLVWTIGGVALGIVVATADFGGRTALERVREAWRRAEAGQWLRERAEDAADRARGALGQTQRPRERHSDEDRAALDRIIAKRSR